MLEQLKQWLTADNAEQNSTPEKEVAITALLSEVMLADGDASNEQYEKLELLLGRLTKQSPADIQKLLADKRVQPDQIVSLYEFTSQLKNLPITEREDILYSLWVIAFSNGLLDPQEEAVIRQVADLLYIRHSRFIWLKQQAQEKAGITL
ncbi:tellurite resistance TerB family protein [Oceanisphaera ostreae]|uniref:TerB family tellurite resistance protein n=1 Tax=Oceanisphaera ostreae TaxID=914151 RepID=A0ABW3KCS1_9GAMM